MLNSNDPKYDEVDHRYHSHLKNVDDGVQYCYNDKKEEMGWAAGLTLLLALILIIYLLS